MKTFTQFLLFVFLSTFSLLNTISAQTDSTVISNIYINNKPIASNQWDKLVFKQSDSVSFIYRVTTSRIIADKILFHVFLNGKIINLQELKNNSISFVNLEEGNYILKIQGYTNTGWEAKPFIQQFIVNNKASIITASSDNAIKNGNNSVTIYLIIGVIAIVIIAVIFVIIKKPAKKESEGKIYSVSDDGNNKEPDFNSKDYKRQNELLKSKIAELNQSIEHIKKEFNRLSEHGKFLKEQIADLKSYVASLEAANAQLVEQKTKLAESKLKLEELQSKKEKLFAIAIHDIKNPASAIKSYVQLLEGYDLNAVEQQEIMQYLTDTSQRILELAQQMSVVIAKEGSEQGLKLQKASLKFIIDSVCNQNTGYAKNKGIKIINNASTNCPETLIDPEKIFEAIDNLVSNAIKYSKPDSIVKVRSFFNDNRIFVEVIDNGIGLTPEDMTKLFIKGAQLSAKPTAGEETSGLGLWIVKSIIDDHGGKIYATSKKDIGSTFTFELPIINKE